MSSNRPPSALGSSVFQRVLLASGSFVILASAALWLIGLWNIAQIEHDQRVAIEEAVYGIDDLISDNDLEELADWIIDLGDEEVWDDDIIYALLEEDEPVIALRDPDGTLLAGYDGLKPDLDWHETVLDHPEIDHPILALTIEREDGTTISIARFFPDEVFATWEFLRFGTWALVLIVLPLSLITGYVLSRNVFLRIERISETAAKVASGVIASRIPLTHRMDEFDRLGDGLNRMLDRLEALNANIESVSVGVAHDLKTPLANLGGRLELLDRDLEDPEEARAHIAAAEDYLAQVLRIFDALLRLGEVEAGRRKAAFDSVDLSDLVQGMADSYGAVFEDANKSLAVAIDTGHVIDGDAELLAQMLGNLFDNAVEHSRDAARAFVSLGIDQTDLVLRVGDDGPGISPQDRQRIFERFYRADRSRSTPGNGLGLSLVKAIADLHGAALHLDPNAPGAVFELRWPQR